MNRKEEAKQWNNKDDGKKKFNEFSRRWRLCLKFQANFALLKCCCCFVFLTLVGFLVCICWISRTHFIIMVVDHKPLKRRLLFYIVGHSFSSLVVFAVFSFCLSVRMMLGEYFVFISIKYNFFFSMSTLVL